jgi:hypothetical protein
MKAIGGPKDGQELREPDELEQVMMEIFGEGNILFFPDSRGSYRLSHDHVQRGNFYKWERCYKWVTRSSS